MRQVALARSLVLPLGLILVGLSFVPPIFASSARPGAFVAWPPRIYLYAHANPVNNVDPSGNDIGATAVGQLTVQSVHKNSQAMGLGTVATFAHAVRTSLAYKIGAYSVLSILAAGNIAMPADAYVHAGLPSQSQHRLAVKRLVNRRLEQLDQENPGQLLYHYTSVSRAQSIVLP